MAADPQGVSGAFGRSRWISLGVVALLAVVAGLVLPQMMSSMAPESTPTSLIDKPGKGQLVYTPPSWPDAPDPKAMLGRLALGTALVLGLCVLTLWIGKRWLQRGATATPDNGRIQIIETLGLGNRCTLHLVRIGGQQVLVGIDGTGLKSMVALPEPFDNLLMETPAQEVAAIEVRNRVEAARTTQPAQEATAPAMSYVLLPH